MFLTSTLAPSRSHRLAHGDIGVAAERALLHVAGRDTDVAQDLAKGDQIVARFLRGAQIGLPDDLHQGHAGAVQIDQADLAADPIRAVNKPPGVFLDVDAGDPRPPRFPAGLEIEQPLTQSGKIVLGDLVALGEIWVEVILAVELAESRDLAVQREPGQDRGLDRRPVQHRKRPGKTRHRPGRRAYSAGARRIGRSSRSTSCVRVSSCA